MSRIFAIFRTHFKGFSARRPHKHVFLLFVFPGASRCLYFIAFGTPFLVFSAQHPQKIVKLQCHPNHVKHPDMESLNASFNEDSTSSTFSGSVVELSGEIISFASTEDGLYTVTISDGETNVLCVFDDDIADKLGIESAPWIGNGTLSEMVEIAREGYTSHWGYFDAEGIVARPVVELLDRFGQRIISKVKANDFRK